MLSRISPQRLALVSLVLFLLTGAFTLVVFDRIESLIGQGGQQYTIFRLGNTLRQTSEDLTSMARLHVTTGEARYREYFEEILAIRNGEAPWPRQYANQPYWDIVLATGERPGEFGEPRSIEFFSEAFGVSAEGAALLAEAERASNALAQLEREAMDVVDAHLAAGGDYSVIEGDLLAAIQRLHGQEYHEAKERIMTPLVNFAQMSDSFIDELGNNEAWRILMLLAALAIVMLLGIVTAALTWLRLRRALGA